MPPVHPAGLPYVEHISPDTTPGRPPTAVEGLAADDIPMSFPRRAGLYS
ncbi:hypothetical protein [Streptomyces hokutonensis]|uniref:Uncharacterized protein n=1 Tax=Streptomyces hokutonensis TaxID=1306990 RepID=A0ABW6MF84_9ACTN